MLATLGQNQVAGPRTLRARNPRGRAVVIEEIDARAQCIAATSAPPVRFRLSILHSVAVLLHRRPEQPRRTEERGAAMQEVSLMIIPKLRRPLVAGTHPFLTKT